MLCITESVLTMGGKGWSLMVTITTGYGVVIVILLMLLCPLAGLVKENTLHSTGANQKTVHYL